MIFAFLGKAVAAGKVAVVGDVQAQRLHHGLSRLEIKNGVPVDILREQQARLPELGAFRQCLPDQVRRVGAGQLPTYALLVFSLVEQGNRVIHQIVHHVHASAVHVEDDVKTVVFKLMDQKELISLPQLD